MSQFRYRYNKFITLTCTVMNYCFQSFVYDVINTTELEHDMIVQDVINVQLEVTRVTTIY